jgi:hypothetical protein
MNLEAISRKQSNELEQQIRQLMVTMRKAKLHDGALFESLQTFAGELEKVRHEQFDDANTEYHTY